MLVVTFSLPDESGDFIRQMTNTRRIGRGVGSYVEGLCGEVPVLVWHVGIGAPSATAQMTRLLAYMRPSLVICAGYAGALRDDLALGDVVLDRRKTSPWLPLTPPPGTRSGRIVTAEKVVESIQAKQQLGLESGAIAVDMETAILAQACAPAGIPVVALRSISDRVQDALPIPLEHWFDLERQRPAVVPLLWHLTTHPAKIRPFIRFVRSLQPARAALAVALVQLIDQAPRL